MSRINILGVAVDMVNMDQAVEKVASFLSEDAPHTVFTPNSEIIMAAYRDNEFCKTLNTSDLVVADGIGVVYASKILGRPLAERVAGYDLACRVLKMISGGEHSLYLFGGKPGVCEEAIKNLKSDYPALNICGFSDGYFDAEKEKNIIEDIKAKKPDIIFVCLGAPKQEKWIAAHKDELGAKLLMGIGGSLDVFAGVAERAPLFYQKAGIEWLYRLAKNPSRIGRMMDLPRFAVRVLLYGKKFKQED